MKEKYQPSKFAVSSEIIEQSFFFCDFLGGGGAGEGGAARGEPRAETGKEEAAGPCDLRQKNLPLEKVSTWRSRYRRST